MRRNRANSLVGQCPDSSPVYRVAAHLYEIESATERGLIYRAYVQSLRPTVFRCMCMSFITAGICKHREPIVAFERRIAKRYPNGYRAEKRRQRQRVKGGFTIHPWNQP